MVAQPKAEVCAGGKQIARAAVLDFQIPCHSLPQMRIHYGIIAAIQQSQIEIGTTDRNLI